ncbi:MAG: sulfatase-like hydrolase/transferase [Lentisphaerae bacterium]|nr:sulfatase-like hydrolase/transferase [Lentisphaerota bacterium]
MSAQTCHPNIVIICSDQHRADTIGSYGSTICRTPALDRLASQGVQFDRCLANNPVCSPSRATILTGCQSARHGLVRNGYALPHRLPTVAETLQAHGYRTHAVGKLHITPHNQGIAEAPFYGFEAVENSEDPKIGPYLDWAIEHYPDYAGYLIGTLFNLPTDDAYWRGKRDLRQEVARCREQFVKPHEISATCNWGYGHFSPLPEEAHQTTWITNRAIAAVEAHAGERPLMLWVGYQDPHNPFDPPARFRAPYAPDAMPSPIGRDVDDTPLPPHLRAFRRSLSGFTDHDWRTLKALYYGSVSFMDAAIGRLLQTVERRLDMRHTIVVYLADHGEILGDHGICGKWAYHYDACTRVPMIWRQDGRWAGGARRSAIIELGDFAPTLLDAAGIGAGPAMDGASYLPLLAGESLPGWRDHAYVESYNGAPTDPTPPPLCWPRTIRTDRYRCTFYADPAVGELYDLQEDPGECRNRYADPACRAIVDEHRQRLVSRLILRDYPLPERPFDV